MTEENGELLEDPVWIQDGLTLDGYIAAEPGLHGELGFRYRPMFIAERSAVQQAIVREPNAKGSEVLAAKKVAQKVLAWEGHDAPAVSPEAVLRLHPELNVKLFSVIMMKRPSDPRPGDATSFSDDVDLHADAALDESTPEDMLAKN